MHCFSNTVLICCLLVFYCMKMKIQAILANSLRTSSTVYHHFQSRLTELEQQCQIQLTALQSEASQLRQDKEQDAAAASKQINGKYTCEVFMHGRTNLIGRRSEVRQRDQEL